MGPSTARAIRSAICLAWILAMAVAVTFVGERVCGQQLTPYRLDPLTGQWVGLPPGNSYASIEASGPAGGAGNLSPIDLAVQVHAAIERDPNGSIGALVFHVDHAPVSREIQMRTPNVFVVPTGKSLQWTLVITVRNDTGSAVTGVTVSDEFAPQFDATVGSVTQGRAAVSSPPGSLIGRVASMGERLSGSLRWDIGTLPSGQEAKLVAALRTVKKGGVQEISSPQTCLLSGGARLVYVQAGPPQVLRRGPVFVIARRTVASGLPGFGQGGYGVQEPTVGDGSQAFGRGVTLSGFGVKGLSLITETAVGQTANISQNPDGSFNVPAGQAASWAVTITVTNPGPGDWGGTMVTDVFGPEIEVSPAGAPPPGLSISAYDPVTGTAVTWDIGNLGASGSASLVLQASTRVTAAGQEYVVAGLYALDSGAVLVHDGSQAGTAGPIQVHVGPWASYSFSATRLDWRTRYPGKYACKATDIHVEGYGSVTIQFAGFEDLTCPGGSPKNTVDTYYGFGDTLAAAETAGWVRASGMSGHSVGPSDISSPGVDLRLWGRVDISSQNPSGEYADEATITVMLSNAGP